MNFRWNFLWFFWLLPVGLSAQTAPAEPRVVSEQQWNRAARGLDYSRDITPQQWEKASGGLDYSRDVAEQEEPAPRQQRDTPSVDWAKQFQALANVFQVLAILLAVALIGYGIYYMLRQPRNSRVARDGAEITLDNLDAYIHETDLERFLREALEQGNYPLAVRIYFLQIIKQLSERGAIRWSKEKTNRDYLREMNSHALARPFRHCTSVFERIWYGNVSMGPAEFARLEPAFKALLRSIG